MIKELYSLMLKYNFRPNHNLDQNFIVDKNALNKMVKAIDLKPNDIILEIGGGTGNLTRELIKVAKKVIVIEKDPLMTEILKSEIKSEKLQIVNKNFLEIKLDEYNYTKIVGFIPYSITHNIIEKINGTRPSILVVQKEFAEKLTSVEGFSNYCALSVIMQTYNNIELKDIIKSGSFFPVPKSNSRIITIVNKGIKEDKNYNLFIKNIFRYPNKNLNNALTLMEKNNKKSFDKNKLEEKILLKKVKQIPVEEYQKIFKILKS